jgi:hypothetical protein
VNGSVVITPILTSEPSGKSHPAAAVNGSAKVKGRDAGEKRPGRVSVGETLDEPRKWNERSSSQHQGSML